MFYNFTYVLLANYSFICNDYKNLRHIKAAYSNLCMKIHLTSKQHLTNIFKMRFLMRNWLKYAQQCQNGIFEKMLGNNGTLTVKYGSPHYIHIEVLGIPLITDADKHALRLC